MKNHLTLVALLFLASGTMLAQSPVKLSDYSTDRIKGRESQFLIPFNDHGEWGYSDTLGKILIKPSFPEVHFFGPKKMGDGSVYLAKVFTSAGENFLLPNGDLLLPKKFNWIKQIMDLIPDEKGMPLFIVEKKGKHALYHPQNGLIGKFRFDAFQKSQASETPLYLRDRKTKTYQEFEPKKQSFKPTPYSKIEEVPSLEEGRWRHRTIAITPEADTFAYEAGVYIPFSLVGNLYDLIEMDPPEFEDMSVDDSPRPPSKAQLEKWATELEVDAVIEKKQFRVGGITTKYGFSSLFLVQKGDKMGVLNENGKIILPLLYDKVTLNRNGTQANLELDGKIGKKLFLTHYPTIEPRYSEFRAGPTLRVSRSWTFALFKAKIGDQQVYVGENGVEYFNLD